jgi:phage antirepressor YoqD-like protein
MHKYDFLTVATTITIGDLRLVKFLTDKGALIESKNEKGETPLYIAVERGHLRYIQAHTYFHTI